MKKSLYIGFTILYNFIVTLLASGLGIGTTGGTIPDTPEELGFSLSFLQDIFSLFGDLLKFNVVGIPNAFIIIFIYIPNIVLLLVILGFVLNRDN